MSCMVECSKRRYILLVVIRNVDTLAAMTLQLTCFAVQTLVTLALSEFLDAIMS
jgi:hypothetical protein